MVSLSIILPAYNEARVLAASLARLLAYLDRQREKTGPAEEWEIVVVDDGSIDRTAEIARDASAVNPRIRLVSLPVNQGKGAAVAAGLRAARGQFLVTTDVDLSYALVDIGTVVKGLREPDERGVTAQIISGDRRHPASRLDLLMGSLGHLAMRQVLSTAFSLLVRVIFHLSIRDTQCGLKGFSRDAAMRIVERLRTGRFLADIEVFLIARELGLAIRTVPVHLTCLSRDSTVSVLRDLPGVVRDAIIIRATQGLGRYGRPAARE